MKSQLSKRGCYLCYRNRDAGDAPMAPCSSDEEAVDGAAGEDLDNVSLSSSDGSEGSDDFVTVNPGIPPNLHLSHSSQEVNISVDHASLREATIKHMQDELQRLEAGGAAFPSFESDWQNDNVGDSDNSIVSEEHSSAAAAGSPAPPRPKRAHRSSAGATHRSDAARRAAKKEAKQRRMWAKRRSFQSDVARATRRYLVNEYGDGSTTYKTVLQTQLLAYELDTRPFPTMSFHVKTVGRPRTLESNLVRLGTGWVKWSRIADETLCSLTGLNLCFIEIPQRMRSEPTKQGACDALFGAGLRASFYNAISPLSGRYWCRPSSPTHDAARGEISTRGGVHVGEVD